MGLFERAKRSQAELRCSFCNKVKDEVEKLIAGPRVFICDGCVGICVSIIEEDARIRRQLAGNAAAGACLLCDREVESGEGLMVRGRTLCPDCLGLVAGRLESRETGSDRTPRGS